MTKLRTHYDNLQVARAASPEVITAAYHALSRKHHPDRNVGDPRAAAAMVLINKAYAILSDPKKRRSHDKWIAEKESSQAQAGNMRTYSQAGRAASPVQPRVRFSLEPQTVLERVARRLKLVRFRNWNSSKTK